MSALTYSIHLLASDNTRLEVIADCGTANYIVAVSLAMQMLRSDKYPAAAKVQVWRAGEARAVYEALAERGATR